MTQPFSQILHEWQGFYQLVGESSATLTGLVFIAASLGIRLIDDTAGPKVQTFLTPTVVYFSLALLLSALMNVPPQTSFSLAAQLALLGLFVAGYSLSHLRRLHRFQHEGNFNNRAWIWNVAQPLFAALWFLGAALLLHRSAGYGLDAAAVGVLLLVMVGLHNAWGVTLRLITLTPP